MSAVAPMLYEHVAKHITSMIERGALRTGDRLPSVRRFAREREVSVATVLSAYRLLETRELIEARPKSGHFVRANDQPRVASKTSRAPRQPSVLAPAKISVSDSVATLLASMRDQSVVPLGAANLAPELYPIRALNRFLSEILREMSTAGASYEPSPGLVTLRRQLARRSLSWGTSLGEDDFIITSGAMEAMHLALRAVVRPGDSVAVPSPAYFGILQLLEELGLRVVEIPTYADGGMDIDALQGALKRTKIRACLAMPNFDNPSGVLMNYETRVRLMALIERYDLPLIEDDVFGDLAWDNSRPSTLKALDRHGRVLLCSSISKTIAAGYRVGWIVPGRYAERIARLKLSQSLATSSLEQMAVAEYLSAGGYDRHLRQLRAKLSQQVRAYREAVAVSFPEGTSVSDPRGGYVLWISMPRGVGALQLQAAAAARGIAIAPGPIFGARARYKSHIRLNCGSPWSSRMASAVATLGELAQRLQQGKAV